MATQGRGTAAKRKTGVSASDYPIPPIYVAPSRSVSQDWENVVGWIAACVLVVMLLPLLGILFVDVLEVKQEAKHQQEQVQKLINKAKEK